MPLADKKEKPTQLVLDRLRKDCGGSLGDLPTLSGVAFSSISSGDADLLGRLRNRIIAHRVCRFFRQMERSGQDLMGSLAGDSELANSDNQREALTPLYNMGVIK